MHIPALLVQRGPQFNYPTYTTSSAVSIVHILSREMTHNSSLYCVVATAYRNVLYYRPAYGDVKGFIVLRASICTYVQAIGHSPLDHNWNKTVCIYMYVKCIIPWIKTLCTETESGCVVSWLPWLCNNRVGGIQGQQVPHHLFTSFSCAAQVQYYPVCVCK